MGYWPFAESIARGITGRAPGEGFVVGIQARWGMGKTSAVNLIIEAIRETETEQPQNTQTVIAYFNPWLFAGLDALASGYLKQLGQILDSSLGKTASASTLNFVRKLIGGGSEFLGAAAAVGLVAASGGGAAPFSGAVGSGVKKAAERVGADRKKSVEDLLAEVSESLHKIPHRIVLVIDDLDRLTPTELRQILTLVKTFGTLPKVTHLLVYDRNIVDPALESEFEIEPPEGARTPTYREKIVQVEVDLPPPSDEGLRRLTETRLGVALGGDVLEADTFWFRVWAIAYRHYLLSPRDIVRFMNALSITWPAVRGEVYPPDLIMIELLRHFERRTYEAIRHSGSFLVGQGEFYSKESKEAQAKAILDTIEPAHAKQVERLLASLFPAINRVVGTWGEDGPGKPLSGRRIRDPDGFAAFFGFSPVSAAISMDERRTIAARLGDASFLRAQVEAALAKDVGDTADASGKLLDVLSEIAEAGDGPHEALLLSMLQTADALAAKSAALLGMWTSIDNHERIRQLIRIIISKWPTDSVSLLREIILDASTSLSFGAFITGLLGGPHGLVFRTDNEQKFDETVVRGIGAAFCERVKQVAESGSLSEVPDLGLVLLVWQTFADDKVPHDWVVSSLATASSAAAITLAIGSFVRSTAEPHTYYEFNPENLTPVLVLDEILPAISAFLKAGAVPQARLEAVGQVVAGAEKWLGMREA